MRRDACRLFWIALAFTTTIPTFAQSRPVHLSCKGSADGVVTQAIVFDEGKKTVRWNSMQGEDVVITDDRIMFQTKGGKAAGPNAGGTDNTIDRTTGEWRQDFWGGSDIIGDPSGGHQRTRTFSCVVVEKQF